ncbi:MAG: hypothetical protein RIE56_11905, partial [Amphiplicatus sp.]
MRPLSFLALILAAACAREDAPTSDAAPASAEPLKAIQLPADYVPGGVYGMDPSECEAVGGSSTTDGNGLSFCSLGATYAVFVCEGGLIVSLVERDAGRKILHLSTGDFAEALPAAGEGEIWVTGDYTLTIAGGEAEFINAG